MITSKQTLYITLAPQKKKESSTMTKNNLFFHLVFSLNTLAGTGTMIFVCQTVDPLQLWWSIRQGKPDLSTLVLLLLPKDHFYQPTSRQPESDPDIGH